MSTTTLGRTRARRNWWTHLNDRLELTRKLRVPFSSGRKHREIVVVCTSGVVWVTAANDATDYFVRSGESLCLKAKGQVVAHALGEADFRVERCEVKQGSDGRN